MRSKLTAVIGATVIDGTGTEPLSNAVVMIEDGRIKFVARGPEAAISEHAEVIDATGYHIIPGIINANSNLCNARPVILEYEGRYEELILEAVQVTLKAGVTTEFSTWGPLQPLVNVREQINRGEVVGSRMFVGGNIIGFAGPLSPDFTPPGNLLGPETIDRINRQWEQGVGSDLVWLPPDEVRHRVRDYIERADIDLVKYAACRHLDAYITFSEQTQLAIVEEAHRAGLTVQAHTLSVESLRMMIAAGADILQHGNITGKAPMPEKTLAEIVERQLPISAIIPTPRYLAWLESHGSEWYRTIGFTQITAENNRRLISAGAQMLLNVDGHIVGPRVLNHPVFAPMKGAVDYSQELGNGHFLWLEAAIGYGMAPMDALLSATRNTARAYGKADDIGTLEPGKRADLLILERDPLADPQNYRRIVEVMKDGLIVDRNSLPSRRILTAPAPPN